MSAIEPPRLQVPHYHAPNTPRCLVSVLTCPLLGCACALESELLSPVTLPCSFSMGCITHLFAPTIAYILCASLRSERGTRAEKGFPCLGSYQPSSRPPSSGHHRCRTTCLGRSGQARRWLKTRLKASPAHRGVIFTFNPGRRTPPVDSLHWLGSGTSIFVAWALFRRVRSVPEEELSS